MKAVAGVLVLCCWVTDALFAWRREQRRKTEAAIARGTVETRTHAFLDRIALVFTAVMVGGAAFYASGYGDTGIWLVFGLVWLAFTGWRWLKNEGRSTAFRKPRG